MDRDMSWPKDTLTITSKRVICNYEEPHVETYYRYWQGPLRPKC